MPKANGNDKATRAAMLSDALADDGTEPVDIAPTPVPPSYAPVAPAVVAPAVPADMSALIQMLAAALNQNGAQTAEAIKTALADAAVMAREPIPENKVAPGVSVYSKPAGDLKDPRTKLRCPMFLGVYDEEGRATAAFEIDEDTSTEPERVLLNTLTPGVVTVERNDGMTGACRVVQHTDDLGQPIRLVIAVPQTWLAKDQQHQMPALPKFLMQLTAA